MRGEFSILLILVIWHVSLTSSSFSKNSRLNVWYLLDYYVLIINLYCGKIAYIFICSTSQSVLETTVRNILALSAEYSQYLKSLNLYIGTLPWGHLVVTTISLTTSVFGPKHICTGHVLEYPLNTADPTITNKKFCCPIGSRDNGVSLYITWTMCGLTCCFRLRIRVSVFRIELNCCASFKLISLYEW